jgi:hypothetical protein
MEGFYATATASASGQPNGESKNTSNTRSIGWTALGKKEKCRNLPF